MATCAACGQRNGDTARFCSACGTVLEGRAPPRGEERRLITALFCDLVGFTAVAERADPEHVDRMLRVYHTLARAPIEAFGGSVEKFIGDAVVGIFGVPVAHEDDPARAVHAALRILEEAATLETPSGEPLGLRIGVNTGEVLVRLDVDPRSGEPYLAGDAINTTSRLQSAAPVMGVAVGEGTYRATETLFDYEALEPVAAKGKTEPLRIWRPRKARDRASVEASDPRSVFVGRADELAALETAVAEVRGGSARLVTIIGEPGVGKSRLVAELYHGLHRLDEPPLWRTGRCLPYGDGITFWALGEIVKAHAGILESDDALEAAAKLASAVDAASIDASDRDWVVARLAPLIGTTTADPAMADPVSMATAWRRFVRGIARVQPLILVFEDLHWADDALLDFVETLADVRAGVLVLCTARRELLDRRRDWGSDVEASIVALSSLSRPATTRLITALLDDVHLRPDLLEMLLDKAEGNPLYAEQFVRMIGDRAIADGADADVPVPDTLRGLISARLDMLPERPRRTGQDASVVGRVFWSGPLAELGRTDEREVLERLAELTRRDLVRGSDGSSLAGQSEFAFTHALVRDVAYAQIPRTMRASKHRAVAGWIERSAGARASDVAELLAYHLTVALELTRAFGSAAEAEELIAPAISALRTAGDRAMSLNVAQARRFYLRALELLAEDDPRGAEILAKAAEAASLSGFPDEAREGFERAYERFLASGDRVGAGATLVGLATHLQFAGRTEEAGSCLDRSIDLLGPEGPSVALLRAYSMSAALAMMDGRNDECLRRAERATDLAAGLPDPAARPYEAQAIEYRGYARCAGGDEEGLKDLEDALRRCLELDLGRETVYAYNDLGGGLALLRGSAATLVTYREGLAFADRRGLVVDSMFVRANLLQSLKISEPWDELLSEIEEFRALEEAHGEGYAGALVWQDHLALLVGVGRIDEALGLLETAERRARSTDLHVLGPVLAAAAEAALAAGDRERALGYVREVEEITRESPDIRMDLLHQCFDVLVEARDRALAAALLDEEFPTGARSFLLSYGRAGLAEIEDRFAEAAELYDLAAGGAEEIGEAVVAARARRNRGRCLLALGRPNDATTELERARETFARFATHNFTRQTDALLEEARPPAVGP